VPAITLQGEAMGTTPPEASASHVRYFTGPFERRTIPRVGHNIPQEAPRETAEAILTLVSKIK
jgi:pimeloyl-ACP methyl ester carboxylesterase